MFKNCLSKELVYPSEYISPLLADFLKLMLDKFSESRINKGQTSTLKNHPWCKDVDWQAVSEKRTTPPFTPNI